MNNFDKSVDPDNSSRAIHKTSPGSRRNIVAFFKRLFDVVSSALALLILSPFFVIISIAIKRDSPGPVYFRGDRMGKSGKPFKMLKFRTMYETLTSYAGSSITGNGDERVTPFGHWLRKTKVNELPQLINVLKGQMSIVGPRPEDIKIASGWPEAMRDQILSVRPGITSAASIIYRDEERLLNQATLLDDYLKKILPDKLRLDQLYVETQSFWTDLDLIFTTLIIFLPSLRNNVEVTERTMFSGPFFSIFSRVFRWFLIDVLVTVFSVGLAGVVWRISTVINLGVLTFIVVALIIAIFISLFNALMGLHKVNWQSASPTYVLDMGLSVFLTFLIIWLANRYWLTEPWIPFSMFWLMAIMVYISLVAIRFRERLLTGLANRWLIMRGEGVILGERILVIGAGELGELAIFLLQRSKFANLFGVVGIVDDDPRKQGMRVLGYKVLGATQDIHSLVDKYKIGLVIFAIAELKAKDRERILKMCRSCNVRTVVIPDLVKVLERSIKKMDVQEGL
ncbi:MAG: sugar transferase [Anaerolineaceae bacterium]|nr:sugar transferase [Anaerolineaceae bacterium]